jgi:hypothetical protein
MQEVNRHSLVRFRLLKRLDGSRSHHGQCWADVNSDWNIHPGAEFAVEFSDACDTRIRVQEVYRAPLKTPGAGVIVVPELVAEEISRAHP